MIFKVSIPAGVLWADSNFSYMSTLTKLDSATFFSQVTENGTLVFTRLVYILFKPFIIALRVPQRERKLLSVFSYHLTHVASISKKFHTKK